MKAKRRIPSAAGGPGISAEKRAPVGSEKEGNACRTVYQFGKLRHFESL
jgi:hypothetical protein